MSVSLPIFFPLTGMCDRDLTHLFAADSSPASALERAVHHCQGEADRELLSGRIQIIKYVLREDLTYLNLLLSTQLLTLAASEAHGGRCFLPSKTGPLLCATAVP
jgi:hypothetical protein